MLLLVGATSKLTSRRSLIIVGHTPAWGGLNLKNIKNLGDAFHNCMALQGFPFTFYLIALENHREFHSKEYRNNSSCTCTTGVD